MTKFANPVIARPRRKNAFFKHAEIDEFTKLVIGRPQRLHQTGENDKKKNVILNEVKNLFVGLPFVSMRFFTSFRMTEGRFVISRNEAIQKKKKTII